MSQALTALSTNETQDPNLNVDTVGANAHVTNDPGKLLHARPCIGNDKLVMRDGSKLKISHIGDASFKSDYGTMELKNVLCLKSRKI